MNHNDQVPLKYTDPYNVAINYLGNKYGWGLMYYTEKFNNKLRSAKNAKERDILIANITEDDIIRAIKQEHGSVPIIYTNPDDYRIYLLVKQYNLSLAIKKELCTELKCIGFLVEPII